MSVLRMVQELSRALNLPFIWPGQLFKLILQEWETYYWEPYDLSSV